MKPKCPKYKGHFPSLAAVLQVYSSVACSFQVESSQDPIRPRRQTVLKVAGGVGKNSVLWLGYTHTLQE